MARWAAAMARWALVAIALAIVAAPVSVQGWNQAYGTKYRDGNFPGQHHCCANGFDNLCGGTTFHVAVGDDLLGGQASCNTCMEIMCDPSRPLYGKTDFCQEPGKVYTFVVTNKCPECASQSTTCEGCSGTHIDIWEDAFDQMASGTVGLMNILWRPCGEAPPPPPPPPPPNPEPSTQTFVSTEDNEVDDEPPPWKIFQGIDLTQFPAGGPDGFKNSGCKKICTNHPPPLEACNPSVVPRGCEELKSLGACSNPDMSSTLFYPRGFCQYSCDNCNSKCTPQTSYRGLQIYQITSVDQVSGLAQLCSGGGRRLLDASTRAPLNLTAAIVA